MADELNRAADEAQIKGEELGHQTQAAAHQAKHHNESVADHIVNAGSDLGHLTAEGAHNLAEGIHDAVAGGLGHLFHHDHPAPTPPPAPPAETSTGNTYASEGTGAFDTRLDTPERGGEENV